MLSLVAVAGLAGSHGPGILAALFSFLAVGVALNPALQRKNSGWLRYFFGNNPGTGAINPRAVLAGGAAPVILTCLGDPVNDLTYDDDGQAFGESPGHAAITGALNTLFSGSNVLARDASPVGQKVTPDPNSGQPQGLAPTVASTAGARIPAGTKVRAWFVPSDLFLGPAAVPAIKVQTEIKQNRMVRGLVEDATGPTWLSSIRVAIQNIGGAQSSAAGVLWVDLQHSHLDIPATFTQDSTNTVGIA